MISWVPHRSDHFLTPKASQRSKGKTPGTAPVISFGISGPSLWGQECHTGCQLWIQLYSYTVIQLCNAQLWVFSPISSEAPSVTGIGLIQVKEEGWTGFSKGWQDCSKGFPEGNPEEQPCQPEENPVHPDSFTWIYILFKKGQFGDISVSSNIAVWRSIIVAKFLEYEYRIIRIFLVLLCYCYVPKIQFHLMIFSLVKKTSPFITLIVSCN